MSSHWGQLETPTACDDVIIGSSRTIDVTNQAECFAIEVLSGGVFEVGTGAVLDVWVDRQ